MQRRAIDLRAAGFTRREIADRLGVTPQAAKKRFSRARQRVSRQLAREQRERYRKALEKPGRKVRLKPLPLSLIENV